VRIFVRHQVALGKFTACLRDAQDVPEPEDFDEQSLFVPEEREAVRIFVRHQIQMDCPISTGATSTDEGMFCWYGCNEF